VFPWLSIKCAQGGEGKKGGRDAGKFGEHTKALLTAKVRARGEGGKLRDSPRTSIRVKKKKGTVAAEEVGSDTSDEKGAPRVGEYRTIQEVSHRGRLC